MDRSRRRTAGFLEASPGRVRAGVRHDADDCADVLLRNVRLIPSVAGSSGATRFSEARSNLVTMLTAPWLLRRGQHIRVDIVLRAVRSRSGWIFEWRGRPGLRMLSFITYYGTRARRQLQGGLGVDQTLVTPEWWLLSVLRWHFSRCRRNVFAHAACSGPRCAARRRGVDR